MSGIYGISSTYTPLLLSHQTGLSATASTALSLYTVGSSISIPRNGIVVISMSGHISSGQGYVIMKLTRGSTTYQYGYINGSSSVSMFANYNAAAPYIYSTSSSNLFAVGDVNEQGSLTLSGASPSFILPVYSGDSLQFYVTNYDAGNITYIDDVLVMLI